MKLNTWLLDFQRNKYSQTGEDGVIEKALEIIPQADKWCVEFGAWDGCFASNTRNLIENHGYSAVLIEAAPSKFLSLKENYAHRQNVITRNAFVGFALEDGLDSILTGLPIPVTFDFLSIDIDGNDYHTWKGITKYRPKIICIEFNPTIPTEVEFVQPANPSLSQGTSLLSLVKMGKEKGYELVSVLHCNAFFVDSKYYPLFEIEDNRPQTLRKDMSAITYLFTAYDGTIFLTGSKRLPWHRISMKARKAQQLPRFLRRYPGNYSLIRKLIFGLYLLVSSPGDFLKLIRQRLGLWDQNERGHRHHSSDTVSGTAFPSARKKS
jgi:hypothetical protein